MSPEYIGSIHQGQSTNQEHKVQKSMKPLTEKKKEKNECLSNPVQKSIKKEEFKIKNFCL